MIFIDPSQNLSVGNVVVMRKPHACGENKWEIIRYGADVKLKCMGCSRVVLLERPKFKKNVKKLLNES